MIYDFDRIIDRRASESIKWHHHADGVLPLWVADMDFESPAPVIKALQSRVEHGIFGYPGEPERLKNAIRDRLVRLYEWQVDLEAIIILPGVISGFNLACRTFARPGQGVLVQTPVYPPFLSAPHHAGLIRQEMELTRGADGSYSVDFAAFEAAITDQTRLFILCNPHNPVGRVFRRDELEQMGEICQRHNLVICSDEIHCDLIFSGQKHCPIASLTPEVAARTVTLMAPSKTFNIAGLNCAFAVIQDEDLRRQFQLSRHGLVGGANLLGLIAALAAYEEGQSWLDELLFYLEDNRDFLIRTIQTKMPEIKVHAPEGTYLAWLDCRQLNLEPSACQFFIEQARVALNDGANFGRGGAGFARLNFGCPRSLLEEALERMQAALRK